MGRNPLAALMHLPGKKSGKYAKVRFRDIGPCRPQLARNAMCAHIQTTNITIGPLVGWTLNGFAFQIWVEYTFMVINNQKEI